MRKRWYFVVPAAIVGIALFIFIGGELVMQSVELAAARAVRMAPDYVLAGGWDSGAVPDSFRADRGPRVSWFGLSRAHGPSAGRRMTPEEREKFRQGMRGRCGVRAGGWRKQGARCGHVSGLDVPLRQGAECARRFATWTALTPGLRPGLSYAAPSGLEFGALRARLSSSLFIGAGRILAPSLTRVQRDSRPLAVDMVGEACTIVAIRKLHRSFGPQRTRASG